MTDDSEHKCQWPDCSAKAVLFLEGRPEGERLCVVHATQAVNSPENIAMMELDLKRAGRSISAGIPALLGNLPLRLATRAHALVAFRPFQRCPPALLHALRPNQCIAPRPVPGPAIETELRCEK
jgi:hypothetical protein